MGTPLLPNAARLLPARRHINHHHPPECAPINQVEEITASHYLAFKEKLVPGDAADGRGERATAGRRLLPCMLPHPRPPGQHPPLTPAIVTLIEPGR